MVELAYQDLDFNGDTGVLAQISDCFKELIKAFLLCLICEHHEHARKVKHSVQLNVQVGVLAKTEVNFDQKVLALFQQVFVLLTHLVYKLDE